MGGNNNDRSSDNQHRTGGVVKLEEGHTTIEKRRRRSPSKKHTSISMPASSTSSFDYEAVKERQTRSVDIAHRYLSASSLVQTPVSSSSDNGGTFDMEGSSAYSSKTSLVCRNSQQICARCLSPILGHRRKSKMCELCTAKMTYGITNEFSELKLKQRRNILRLNDNATHQSTPRPSLSMPLVQQDRFYQQPSPPANRCTIHQSLPRPPAVGCLETNPIGLYPPPNVFPFGDGIAGIKANDDTDGNDEHGGLIWRPF